MSLRETHYWQVCEAFCEVCVEKPNGPCTGEVTRLELDVGTSRDFGFRGLSIVVLSVAIEVTIRGGRTLYLKTRER